MVACRSEHRETPTHAANAGRCCSTRRTVADGGTKEASWYCCCDGGWTRGSLGGGAGRVVVADYRVPSFGGGDCSWCCYNAGTLLETPRTANTGYSRSC